MEEELTPFRKVVGTAEKHTTSLPGTPAFLSAHSGPAASGERDAESGRLASKFRLISKAGQDPHAEPKATAPLICLPKVRLLEPKAVHCTKRDG